MRIDMATPRPSRAEDSVVAQAADCAIAFHQRGMLAEAEKFYLAILNARPDHFDALRLLGVLRQQQGDNAEAMRLIGAALAMNPRSLEVLSNFAGVLYALGRYDEALATYDRALAITPDHPETLYNRGNALLLLGRAAEALAAFDRALSHTPGHPDMLVNRGNALLQLDRAEEALADFDRVLASQPDHAGALSNRATALKALRRYEDALELYRSVLEKMPDSVATLDEYGSTLLLLGRAEQAFAIYERLLATDPDRPGMLGRHTDLLHVLGRHEEAVNGYDKLLAAAPHDPETLYKRGKSLWATGRREAAMDDYERARALGHLRALDELAMCRMRVADWRQTDELAARLSARIAEDKFVDPFVTLAFGLRPREQFEAALHFVRTKVPAAPKRFIHKAATPPDKLRIAYVSSDFRQHPVGTAIAELIESHDRTRFEIIGVSYGANDASDVRGRIVKAFDEFHDVASDTDDQRVATLLNGRQAHIAVALNGLTGGARLGVLAHRPVPIQVSYLGYAGTTGADFIDYVLADETVLPSDQQPFYTEKIVHLPGCYHANDTTRRIAPQTPLRSELGLPDQGLVFCCFNQSYKITAPVFDIWMRLLARIPGSVLWLTRMDDLTHANLRREAAARGVDPARLVFAPRVDSLADHLARQRAADLFLDTLPYNAHSTTCDALWTGVPVVTCAGATFAGRVAASMLEAVGLPELVTNSPDGYEALALGLATDPARLSTIRRKLAGNRATCPLFDGDGFRRNIEAAYSTMWDIYRRGESPRSFRVKPNAATSGASK
jgi:predicted O-linked N-acetylglucosamine transferase (SPINDLY family)